jgi:hypothetical protein
MPNNKAYNSVKKPRLKLQNIIDRIIDRRKTPRFSASAIPTLKSISWIGGPEVELINISRSGAMIESHERMLPGSDISLRLAIGEDVFLLKGRIVRSSTSPKKGRIFQSGIAFNEEFKLLPRTINLFEDEDILKKNWP